MTTDTPSLRAAVARATAYLEDRLRAGDYWLSCVATQTESPWPHEKGFVFAGFFLAEALGGDLSEAERSILVERIQGEAQDGLWSYAIEAHPGAVSADDTSFALRTARALGVPVSIERLLAFYREPDAGPRGFTTFLNLIPPQPRLAFEQSVENHRQLHPEVNANVFLALEGTALSGYLDAELIVRSQAPEGWWHSYCYPSRYYATWLFLDYIRDDPALSAQRERGLAFLRTSQNEDGSWGAPGEPYETALALNALAVCGETSSAFQRGIRFLLASQEEDGSWSTPKPIWEYLEKEGDHWQAFDANRVIATSLALLALKRARSRA